MYLKQHGLKLINGSKADLLNEFSDTHVEMLAEMFWKMMNGGDGGGGGGGG